MADERTLRRLERHIWELFGWRNHATRPIQPWTVSDPTGFPNDLNIGDRWDNLVLPVRMEVSLPRDIAPDAVLELFVEGDALVFLDGELVGALSPFEREITVGAARRIMVEVSPNDSFGIVGTEAHIVTSRLVAPDPDVRGLFRELLLVWETCAYLTEHEVTPHLLRAIESALSFLRFPTDENVVLRQAMTLRDELKLSIGVARALSRHYHYDTLLRAIERQLQETDHLGRDASTQHLTPADGVERPTGISEARSHLRAKLGEIANRYPPVGQLAISAHAHLDVAWLWPLAETRRKARHTFASVLALMQRYPDFHFTASSAQLYAYVQRDDPELFERVRARVREGRWEPIGGMWLEPDGNLPAGESLIRQLVLGQRYFEREFGFHSRVAWMPDTFGFTANLPQILAGAGMRFFFTHKLNWNDTNRFPHDLWRWEGLDGTRLTAHSFDNPIGGYNGQIMPPALGETWRNFRGKLDHPESLFTFGMGDGGRGPTSEMLERIMLLDGFPALPALRQSTVEGFFERIDAASLPTWVGELYLEFHRGTYTTQSRLKRLNRMAEHRLYEAEAAATLATLGGVPYPRGELNEAWTTLARNQFHDILPGSSIREVNVEAERELGSVIETAITVRDRALDVLTEPASAMDAQPQQIIVFNPQSFARPLSCVVARPAGVDTFALQLADGHEVPWQTCGDGEILIHADRLIPGFGLAWLKIVPGASVVPAPGVVASEFRLENEMIRVEIANDGTIASIFDKQIEREVLSGPANQLRVYRDLPFAWEAWNLTNTSKLEGDVLTAIESLRLVQTGPLGAAIEIRRRFGSSEITQQYSLRSGSTRLDIHTVIDWHERRTLLRALFPLAIHASAATFETSYGAVQRPTHRNTSWDAAKFEVPAQRWADLSEPDYGVSLLNDGRYGHSALGDTLGLTLLRSSIDPDPLADVGRHEFTYAIFPHRGDWTSGGTVNEAIGLNSPLVARLTSATPTASRREINPQPWLDVDGLTVGSLKLAEGSDDIIVRLYDPYGRRGMAHVRAHFPLTGAEFVNLLEEDPDLLDVAPHGTIAFAYRPFQILTLRLRRTPAGVIP